MKIAVIGPGAIGGLIAGYLKLNNLDVCLAGGAEAIKAIRENGLNISGVRGDFKIKLDISQRLEDKPDLVILSTKIQDIEAALKDNLNFISEAVVLTTQNGVQAENIIAKYIAKEKIASGIVMFGATLLAPGKIVHNFEGSFILGRFFSVNDKLIDELSAVLNKAFPVVIAQDIKGMKYLKLFVNANNCIPAILGKSMQEAFSDTRISAISMAIWKEGLEIINKAGIKLLSLPDFPVERVTKLAALPLQEAAKIYSGIMQGLSKEPLYGSILQSIKRGKPSEIDYLNGEFVSLAKNNNLKAPLNEKLVEMVHQVERINKFFTKDDLLANTKGFLN